MSERMKNSKPAYLGGVSGYLNRIRNIVPWVVGFLLALVAPLAGSALQDIIESFVLSPDPIAQKKWLLYAGYFVAFALAVALMYWVTRWAYRPQTRYLRKDETPEKRKHLLIFLSRRNCDKPDDFDVSGDISTDLGALDEIKKNNPKLFWNREMPLRTLAHHIGKLETFTVICSPQSANELADFVSLLKPYREKYKFEIYAIQKKEEGILWSLIESGSEDVLGIDFEDFDALSIEVSRVLSQMKKRGIRDSDTSIDFTGGLKVASVVAATLTYNRQIKAQYISTNSLKAISYDVVYGTSQIPSIS